VRPGTGPPEHGREAEALAYVLPHIISEVRDDAMARAEIYVARGRAVEVVDALDQVASKPGGGIESWNNAACMFAKAATPTS
jgi:hypothetical protein